MNKLFTTNSPLKAMKKLAICAVLVFVSVNANAQCQDFDKLAKIKGVEYQHVDKNMINLAAKMGEGLHIGEAINIGGGGDAGKILDQFNDVKVFICEEEGNIPKFKKTALKVLKGKQWEPLIDTKGDEGEIVKIYQAKKGEQVTSVILAIEDDEAQLVVLDGTFDITKMMGNVDVNKN